jgi:S1-C subfamily serine protease
MNRISPWVAALAALILLGSTACDVVEQARHALPEPTTPTANAPATAGTPGTTAPGAAAPTPSSRGAPADANARPAPANSTARASGAPTDGLLSVREVSEKVRPAVVQIVTEQAAAGRSNALGARGVQTGIGSGVLFDAKGYILTNHHVVADARTIDVALPDGRTFDAKLVGSDPDTDLAVIHIDGSNLPTAPLGDSDQVAVGDGVVAIGNALGLPGGATVTAGVASALGRTVQEPSSSGNGNGNDSGAVLYDVIQTDAAINPGNSGGPLVDMAGRVIGINTLVAAQAEPGVPAQGIGFAIAINTAKPIADQLVSTGRAIHPYMGVLFQWAGGASARQQGLSQKPGVVIQRVVNGSPAARAGLQRGDVVTQIDGQPIKDEAALPKLIQKHHPGDSVDLTVVSNNNQERTVRVTLAERPQT